jgi:hypothetical protein
MKTLDIKTYSKNLKLKGEYFFILSKGNNAGKPLLNPCPNCFVFTTTNKEEKDSYFWLIHGLWQGNFFKQVLRGSVIPFVRIYEVKSIIAEAAAKTISQKEKFLKTINLLKNLEEQQKTIQKQMQLIQQAKVALMFHILKQ